MPRICLNMIVKDEGAVIERCLQAVLPHIDTWCIVDTGSTDETRERIEHALKGIPGTLHERPWVDFAHNRTEAIKLAQKQDADYLLFLDADDVWTADDDFAWPELDEDAYYVKMRMDDLSWRRTVVVKADRSWQYKNVAHEAVVCEGPMTTGEIRGVKIQCRQDGARRSMENCQEKYARDAEALARQVKEEPWNTRAMFYLAQSYRDAGQIQQAVEWYRRRAEAGGWPEEQWFALLQLARLLEFLGTPWRTVEPHFLGAYALRPGRAEPLVALSRHYRERGEFAQAHLFACAAKDTPYPVDDLLFVDEAVYGWRALDEYAISAYYVGKREQAREANEALLASPELPESERDRVRANLAFCKDDQPAGEPVGDALASAAREHRERLAALHRTYTSEVSTEAMAASNEACALAFALCESLGAHNVLDLGSGYSSAVLRQGDWHVDSVDDSAEWLDKTDAFLVKHGLEGGSMWAAETFFAGAPKTLWDFVFLDLGQTPDRADYLPAAWKCLREGGLMLIDDVHHVGYRERVQEFLADVPHERIDVHEVTRDKFGRYAWLVRRAA